jgi:hypothetical protein
MWWPAKQVRTLRWSLFAWSACAQPATVEAGKTGVDADLTSFLLIGVVTASRCGGEHDRCGR